MSTFSTLEARHYGRTEYVHIHTFFPPNNICTATHSFSCWLLTELRIHRGIPNNRRIQPRKRPLGFAEAPCGKMLLWLEAKHVLTAIQTKHNKTLKLPLINRAWLRSQQTWSSPLVSASSIMIQSLSLGKNMLDPWVSKNSSQNHTCNPEPGSCTTQNWEIHENKHQVKALRLTVVAQNQQRRSQILWSRVSHYLLNLSTNTPTVYKRTPVPRHPFYAIQTLPWKGFGM